MLIKQVSKNIDMKEKYKYFILDRALIRQKTNMFTNIKYKFFAGY